MRVAGKVVPRQDSGGREGAKLCGWSKVVCAKQLLKNVAGFAGDSSAAENACDATSINLEFGFALDVAH